ncbi:MAG: hypothetical protein RLO50_11500 [Azospirillaceae bacterium]
MNPRRLVVCYSDTGHSAAAARFVAEALKAETETLTAPALRPGRWGFFLRALGALLHRPARLAPLRHDPADFETIVLCGPIWAGNLATPLRGYLKAVERHLPRIRAIVLTYSGSGAPKALKALRDLIGDPVAMVAISDAERRSGKDETELSGLVARVLAAEEMWRATR